MICNTACMKCPLPQLFKVNFSRYHGICKSHNIQPSTIHKCINCNTIVPVIFINTNLCVLCNSLLESTHNTLQVCKNCYKQSKSIQSYTIRSKRTVCDLCVHVREEMVLFCKCNHLVCKRCLDTKKTCSVCDSFETGVKVQEVLEKIPVLIVDKGKEPKFNKRDSKISPEILLEPNIEGNTEIIDENLLSEEEVRSLPKKKPSINPTVIKYNTIEALHKMGKPIISARSSIEEIKSTFSENLKNSSQNAYSQHHSESPTTDRELNIEKNKIKYNKSPNPKPREINFSDSQTIRNSRHVKDQEKVSPAHFDLENSQNNLINEENNRKSKWYSIFLLCFKCFKSS